MWIREQPLARLVNLLRWVSRMAASLQAGDLVWSSDVEPWRDVVVEVRSVVLEAVKPFVLRGVNAVDVAWGMSDAAVSASGGYQAFVVRWADGQVHAVRGRKCVAHINVEEFDAAIWGLMVVLSKLDPGHGGRVWWKVDNTVAKSWLKRSWSSVWDRNTNLLKLRERERLTCSDAVVQHVSSQDNVADVLTRCLRCGKDNICICRPDQVIAFAWRVTCPCVGVCDHIREELAVRFAAWKP